MVPPSARLNFTVVKIHPSAVYSNKGPFLMSKTALLAAFLIAAFAPNALAQTAAKPDKAAIRAKKVACEAEAKAKNIVVKAKRKAFVEDCMSK